MRKSILFFGIMALAMVGEMKAKAPALEDALLKADFGSESSAGYISCKNCFARTWI